MKLAILTSIFLSISSCQPVTNATKQASDRGSQSECESLSVTDDCPISSVIYKCTYSGQDGKSFSATTGSCENKTKTMQRLYTLACNPKNPISFNDFKSEATCTESGGSKVTENNDSPIEATECEQLQSTDECAVSGPTYQCQHTGKDGKTYSATTKSCENKSKTIQRLYGLACNPSNLMSFTNFIPTVTCKELVTQ